MITLVIGANGQVGRKIIEFASADGLLVRAMVRTESQAQGLESPGIETVIGDLEQDFAHALTDCSQVVFCAGSGSGTGYDKTLLVDLWGAIKAIQYSAAYKIQRFIMVSSRGADNPDLGPPAIKPYNVAKYAADQALIQSGLNYIILRPGRLVDTEETGRFTTQRPADPEQQVISRTDTARAVLYAVNHPGLNRVIFELYQGNQALGDALQLSSHSAD